MVDRSNEGCKFCIKFFSNEDCSSNKLISYELGCKSLRGFSLMRVFLVLDLLF